jgi:vacuolar-type H+-ATPase subunit I/STV1
MTKDEQIVLDELRLRFSFLLALGGILVAALLVIVLIGIGWKLSSEILPLIGIFTTVMGTLVGMFFGYEMGLSGKERERRERMKAQSDRIKLQEIADRALAKLDPKDAEEIFRGRNY